MTDLATYVAAAGVFVSAAATGISAWAVHTTRAALREGRRARIDSAAPRLAVRVEPVSPPPLVGAPWDVTVRYRPPWEDFRLDVAKEPGQYLYLRTWAKITNEGASSAFLTIPKNACPVSANKEDPVASQSGRWSEFTSRGNPQPKTLGPSESCWLFLEAALSAREWIDLYDRFSGRIDDAQESLYAGDLTAGVAFPIRSADQYAEGVVDNVTIAITGFPLIPTQAGSTVYTVHPPTTPMPTRALARPSCRSYRDQRTTSHGSRSTPRIEL